LGRCWPDLCGLWVNNSDRLLAILYKTLGREMHMCRVCLHSEHDYYSRSWNIFVTFWMWKLFGNLLLLQLYWMKVTWCIYKPWIYTPIQSPECLYGHFKYAFSPLIITSTMFKNYVPLCLLIYKLTVVIKNEYWMTLFTANVAQLSTSNIQKLLLFLLSCFHHLL